MHNECVLSSRRVYPKKPDKTTRVSLPTSERICLLEQVRKLIPPLLQVRIATDVLLVDEDVRYRALLCHLLERVLDGLSVILKKYVNQRPYSYYLFSPTNLVELNGIVLCAHVGEEGLCRPAVRTVRL